MVEEWEQAWDILPVQQMLWELLPGSLALEILLPREGNIELCHVTAAAISLLGAVGPTGISSILDHP
jgi:hypothetical protein